MANSLIIIVLLTSACGVLECEPGSMNKAVTTSFITKYDFTVLPNGHRVVPDQVWEAIEAVETGLRDLGTSVFIQEEFDISMRLIVRGNIIYVGDPFDCSDPDKGTCLGETGKDIKIAHEGCMGETALVHELIHKFNMYAGHDGDTDHKNPDLFEDEGGDDSLEARLTSYQKHRYCDC